MNELADRPPLDLKQLIKKAVINDPQSDIEMAAALEMTVEDANAFVSQHLTEITAEAIRYQLSGKSNAPKAYRIIGKLLDRIEAVAGEVDAFEAADLLKHVMRIIEADDRKKLAEKDKRDNLPIFHININKNTHAITAKLIEPPADDVVDVESRETGGGE